jgi:2-polyprenyl-3-methyl-5-hydroxy-6-metoxy-1,4-benzoquinol methylase
MTDMIARLSQSTTGKSAAPVEYALESASTLCTICGDPMRKKWPSNGLYYFTCPRCQLDRVAPVPTREVLKDYYDKAYEVDREGYRRNLRRYSLRDLKLLERLNGKGRMLEVGCSWGYFLGAARSCGWHVQGLELSDSASLWAKDKLGLDVTCGTIEDMPLAESTGFDVVVAWHVIEHVQDPMYFLKTVRERLRPGGLLALRTPNIRSAPARLSGWAWHWVAAPAHLSLFSPKSLRLAIERAGFSVRHIATRRGDAYNPVFEVLRASALRAAFHKKIKSLLKLQDIRNAGNSPDGESLTASRRSHLLGRLNRIFDIIFFALYPIERLLDSAGWGPELFLVAERRD